MPLKILIVEDLYIEANDLRIIFEQAGHIVTGMPKSVDQALAAIKRDRPDIVLLDIFLKGDLTGIHLARNLRAANIPFIYLSANSNMTTLEAAKATQPDGFLMKPFREKDLLLALDIATHRHRHALDLIQRQERWLGSLLGGIINQVATQEQKMLLLAKALKTFIPFDLLLIDMDRHKDDPGVFFGCHREDPEHFAPIDMRGLMAKFRLAPKEFPLFRAALPYRRQIAVVDGKELGSTAGRTAEKFQRYFGVSCALAVPVSSEVSLFFFNAQPGSYHAERAEVLSPLRNLLASVIDNIRRQGNAVPADCRTSVPAEKAAPEVLAGIVGKSVGLLRVLDQVVQVAPFDSTVLISGETGVGKEGLARAIHGLSARCKAPYIKVNCAAIPDALIESELFGHERGSFTSAAERRIGKFEQANGGTIFLDEIGELPLSSQTKILRVLQEKEVERVGGGITIKLDVRIIAATNRDLYREMAAGRFRMDLYYRLNVFPLTLPPLRDRMEDIPLFVEHFLKQHAARSGGTIKTVSPAVMERFMDYSWPGNIRELQYMIERCVIQTSGPIITEVELPLNLDITGPADRSSEGIGSGPVIEKDRIADALARCNGKVSGKGGAAEVLGINPNTLTSRMKKLGIIKRLLLLLFFAMAGVCIKAQTSSQADLLKLIRQSRPDTNRVDLLLKAGLYHLLKPGNRKEDLDSAFSFFDPALALSRKLHSEEWINACLKWKGDCYLEGLQLARGEACFQEVIDYYRKKGDKKGEVKTWIRVSECISELEPTFREEKIRIYGICRELYRELHDTATELNLSKSLADIYLNANRFDSAERLLLHVAEGYKRLHDTQLHHTYHLLMEVYKLKNDFRKAVFYNNLMIQSLEDSHDSIEGVQLYAIGGEAYFEAKMYDKSLYCFLKYWTALKRPEIARTQGRTFIDATIFSITKLFTLKGNPIGGLAFMREAATKFPENDAHSTMFYPLSWALTYESLKDYKSADIKFQQLGVVLANLGPGASVYPTSAYYLVCIGYLCEFYVLMGQYRKADAYINKMPKNMGPLQDPEDRLRYELVRARIDSGLHRYREALMHFSAYKQLSDSLFNVDLNWQMQELQIKNDVAQSNKDLRQQAAHIDLLDKKNRLQQSNAEKLMLLRNTMIAGIVLLLLLVGVVLNRYRLKQRSNRLLEAQKIEISTNNNRLEKLLHENEWLMREIHHRVKNNLQVVMSLLNSQASYMKDPAAISAVKDGRHRVQAMSLIHQKLYRSKEISSVDMQEYIGELTDYLQDSFDRDRRVDFVLDVAAITLEVSQAIPLGLIVNEVITNSYKYAFSGTSRDRITLRLRAVQHPTVELSIADNGLGLPKDMRFGSNEYFGLSLIRGLSDDLEADLTIDTSVGTAYAISFTAMLPIDAARTVSPDAAHGP